MSGQLEPELVCAESERMEKVLRLLEGFLPRPERTALRLPRLNAALDAGAITLTPTPGPTRQVP